MAFDVSNSGIQGAKSHRGGTDSEGLSAQMFVLLEQPTLLFQLVLMEPCAWILPGLLTLAMGQCAGQVDLL